MKKVGFDIEKMRSDVHEIIESRVASLMDNLGRAALEHGKVLAKGQAEVTLEQKDDGFTIELSGPKATQTELDNRPIRDTFKLIPELFSTIKW